MSSLDYVNIGGTIYEIVPEIAPLFDSTESYSTGDCVIKDAVLYRFTDDHTGAWTGSDVEQFELGEEITELPAEIVKVSDTEPSSTKSRIWIEESEDEYEVPTMDEFEALSDYVKKDINVTLGYKADAIVSSTSGAIAQFENESANDVADVVAYINPVQDLHGYDKPWPAGGGVNLMLPRTTDDTVESYGITLEWDADTESFKFSGTNTLESGHIIWSSINNGGIGFFPSIENGVTYYFSANFPTGIYCDIVYRDTNNTVKTFEYMVGNGNFKTLSGTFSDFSRFERLQIGVAGNATTINASNVHVMFSKTAPASWSPYSNVCPISGFTGMNLKTSGTNIADKTKFSTEQPSWYTGTYWLGLTDNQDGTYILTRPIGWGGQGNVYIGTFPPGSYVFSFDLIDTGNETCASLFLAKKPNTWTDAKAYIVNSNLGTAGRKTQNIGYVAEPFDLWAAIGPYNTNNVAVKSGNYQLEYDSTAHPYTVYQGTTYPITFPQEAGTVYGGYVDVTQGKLVVDRAIKNIPTNTFVYNGTINCVLAYSGYNLLSDAKPPASNDDKIKAIANVLPIASARAINGGTVGVGINTTKDIYIRSSGLSSLAEYQAAFENGINICYELATPTEYDLTPVQIALLLGENNIWHDANGDTDITYRLDLQSHIDQELAPVKEDVLQKADAIVSSASGSIAHFEDGSESDAVDVVAHINPVQDLHGYDSPWPAGGGENILQLVDGTYTLGGTGVTVSISNGIVTANGTATTGGGRTAKLTGDFTLKAGTYYAKPFGENMVLHINKSSDDSALNVREESFTIAEDTLVFAGINVAANVTYSNTKATPMLSEGSTAPTSWSPYSNICPISGFTGCNITGTGKNLLNLVESEMVSDGWNRAFPFAIKAGTYIISCQNQFGASSTRGAKVTLRDSNGNTIITLISNYEFGNSIFSEHAVSITEEQARQITSIVFECRAAGTSYSDITVGNIQIELASTASPYEEYQGQTYPITFPTEAGTVYGGYVDVTQGKLVVDRASVTFDGSVDEVWDKSDYNYYQSGIISDAIDENASANNFASNIYPYGAIFNNTQTCGACIIWRGIRVRLADMTGDVNAWRSLLAQQPMQVVYKLAIPIEYDLASSIAVAILKGENNIWNDANGNTDVEYKADTKLYIEQLTKPTEDDMTANANITSGSFFMVGNRLFLSTSAIATGATIIPGTNCTELSLADALNTITA